MEHLVLHAKRLEATEMWFIRRIMKFSWIEKLSYERVLTIANLKCELLQTMKKRKMTFLGHVMGKDSIENISLTGKVNGKRARGRQRITYLDNVKYWSNTANGKELFKLIKI